MIVTIDGPAGSGKSTVAAKLANKLGFLHLNSGALYRAIGLKAQDLSLDLSDDAALSKLAQDTSFEFPLQEEGSARDKIKTLQLLVDGEDWTARLFTAEASKLASTVAVLPMLREELTEVQRNLRKTNSLVAEGRDAGTIVFPDAEVKFYLDATVEERARRRFEDLKSKDVSLSLEQVEEEMKARDERDETREIAPQVAAEDAIKVDTTELSIEEVVALLCKKIDERRT